MSRDTPAGLTPLYYVYNVLSRLAAPLARRYATKRLEGGQVSPERIKERFGKATALRPKGSLIWIHAVSVGELLSVLGVITTLRKVAPDVKILVTTTTETSGKLAKSRLPKGVIHQFAPLDTPTAVRHFLRHWAPDLAVFTESELWPNQITALHSEEIPLVLLNARLSNKSLKNWRKFPKTSLALMSRFDLALCQVETTRDAIITLGLPSDKVLTSGDLKASSDPLPVNAKDAAIMSAQIQGRSVWVASSTHQGEEESVCTAHRSVLGENPDALLILVPRHPERADALARQMTDDGWHIARRSDNQVITQDTQIYLADTLGETGLWYSLAPTVFVAGSFSDVGGHNPYEPAHFDCAILHGPKVANFAHAYTDMKAKGACRQVEDAQELGHAVADLLPSGDATLQSNAKQFATSAQSIRATVADHLLSFIETTRTDR